MDLLEGHEFEDSSTDCPDIAWGEDAGACVALVASLNGSFGHFGGGEVVDVVVTVKIMLFLDVSY